MKEVAKTLSHDFERVLITISEENIEQWEQRLTAFRLRLLGKVGVNEIPLYFGTKFDSDLKRLDELTFAIESPRNIARLNAECKRRLEDTSKHV